jgi:hypothetical protein
MKYLYSIILTFALSICYGQQIPLYYLKADTTDDIILMVKNNELVLVGQDSLSAGNPVDEISTVATFQINGNSLEIATTSINGGTTTVSTVDLARFDKDSSSTNELQGLTLLGTELTITDSNSVDLAGLNTERTDEEIEDVVNDMMSVGANGLLIKNYNDAADLLTFTIHDRTLTLSNDTLCILGGNCLDLSGLGGGGGATQLSDLTDVNTSTPTNRNALIADGTDWESRAITEADISDLQSYLTIESDATALAALVDTAADIRADFPSVDGTESAFNGWDKDASNDITDDGADQYNNVFQKVDPVGNDRLLIEDSADSWNKKYIKLDSLLGGGGGGSATELGDLTDVGSSTPTNRNVLIADGTDFESRALVEADISDLDHYTSSDWDTDFLDEFVSGFTTDFVPYHNGTKFTFSSNFKFDGTELYAYDGEFRNNLSINNGSRNWLHTGTGNALYYKPDAGDVYWWWRDVSNNNIMYIYSGDQSVRFYGDVRMQGSIQTTSGDEGTSGQYLKSLGASGWEWDDLPSFSGGGDVYKSGTPIANQHAVWVNDSTVQGSSALTDNGSDITISGHLGLDGYSPNGSYSINSGGHAIFNGPSSSWTYIKNNGYIQFRNNSQFMNALIEASDFVFQHQGSNTLRFEADNDVRISDDLYTDGYISANTTPSVYPLKVRGDGATHSTSAMYVENSSSTKLAEVRDDGYGEGELFENNVYTLSAGLVPSSYVYGDYTANAYINNVLYNATDRFNVSATNTSNSNYFYWFDGEYTIGGCDLNSSDTSVVSIEIDGKGEVNSNGLTHPKGRIVVATYTGHELSSNTYGRWKDRNGTWTDLTYNDNVFSSSMGYNGSSLVNLYEFEIPSGNYLTDIELSLVNDNAFSLRVLSIEYYPERQGQYLGFPYLSKYRDETTNKAVTFRDDSNDDEVVIDPSSSTPFVAEGDARFNRNIQDSDGDVGNSNQILSKDDVTSNEMDYVDFHDFNSFMKLRNTASSINLNTVGVTDVSEISVTDFSYGRETMTNTGDIQVPVQGVYECKAVLHLTSLDTASIDLRFYEDGNIVTGGKIYTVHFTGAQDQTVVMNETFQLDAFDDIDIRSTRNGSGTGTVTISATEQAYLQVELKHRGH